MALSADSLLGRIKNKYGKDSEGVRYIRDEEFMRKLSEAIVEEIKNAKVSFNNVATVISPNGPCTGSLTEGKIE